MCDKEGLGSNLDDQTKAAEEGGTAIDGISPKGLLDNVLHPGTLHAWVEGVVRERASVSMWPLVSATAVGVVWLLQPPCSPYHCLRTMRGMVTLGLDVLGETELLFGRPFIFASWL